MKTKFVLIISSCVTVLLCVFFFVRSRNVAKPEKAEIMSFLNKFGNQVKIGNTDSLLTYFETRQSKKTIKRLIGVFSNKYTINGKAKPLFSITLRTDSSEINILNNGLAQARVPVRFDNDKVASRNSFFILTIRKNADHTYKIVQVTARHLLDDYIAYEKKISLLSVQDKDLYSPVTLAAFAEATKLKSRYDSVIYFEHLNKQTYYFVARGSFPRRYNDSNYHYKMGLVNPKLKEVIPVKYDLIHNINGTVEGLIEVEDNHKKGFYNAEGKIIVPVDYDMILPLTDSTNLALLNKGDDYFYLRKNLSISDRLVDFKIAQEFKKIKNYDKSFIITADNTNNYMEYNSRDDYNSVIIPPSYLVDWKILGKTLDLPNPARNTVALENEDGEGEGSEWFKVNFSGHQVDELNRFENIYYSIVDNYLGSRAGLYNSRSVVIIDKQSNKIVGTDVNVEFVYGREGGAQFSDLCNENYMKQLNDTLFELKTTANIELLLPDSVFMIEGPYYHYLHIENGRLKILPNGRLFSFTKYIKLDDSYLSGCYVVTGKRVGHITKQMLQYAKNEIFAEHHYQFKTPMWTRLFENRFNRDDKTNRSNVDDSLTAIDKYNINWINNKLKEKKASTLAAR